MNKQIAKGKKSATNEKFSAAIVIASIEKQAAPLFRRIADTQVKTTGDFDKLAESLAALKELAKMAKAEEQSITGPLNEALKATRAHFKPFTDRVAELENEKKAEMQKFLAAQAAESRRLEEKLENGEIKKVSTLLRKQSELAVQSEHAQVRKVWTLTIVDAKKIPREFLVPDETAVREAFKAGGTVAGCEWKQVETVAI